MDEKLGRNRGISTFMFLKSGFKFPLDKTADHILNTLPNNNARLRAAQCLPFIGTGNVISGAANATGL